MMLYRHLKTGNLYRLLTVAVDCTNALNGRSVAIYCPDDNEHSIYVRELEEFESRFVPVQVPADAGVKP